MPELLKKVAVLQSNYLPWRGYFDLIASVDEFIVYDDMQYTKNDWRNRNRIRTAHGTQWLTVPVRRNTLQQRIRDTQVMDRRWADKHWRTLSQAYARASHFQFGREVLADLYAQAAELEYLTDINVLFLTAICDKLGIRTRISRCSDYAYDPTADRSTRLVQLVQAVGGNSYLSGPAARQYLAEEQLTKAGIGVSWMEYAGYPTYPQVHGGPFEPAVSIVDVLFNMGPAAAQYVWKAGQAVATEIQ
ncbi:WbqC family protein [Hymenobacter sp. BT186]|uniref:WbqC family protein n=1 Tax=Hymenobacter telluris TaxID=2816474 RepID=A0A939EUC0_9BACT|nr:WbqC family protein [Hymenobacter telluris]MBO0357362.1 WbqC family protein [Hymenobacter telluris]MBW3373388.1 WbqC family protein [Hymenobacter norwichensis]